MTQAAVPATPELRAHAATEIIDRLVARLEPLQRAHNEAQWRASVSGTAERRRGPRPPRRRDSPHAVRLRTARPASADCCRPAGFLTPSSSASSSCCATSCARTRCPPATIEAMVEIEEAARHHVQQPSARGSIASPCRTIGCADPANLERRRPSAGARGRRRSRSAARSWARCSSSCACATRRRAISGSRTTTR